MDFSSALLLLKLGHRIARSGWNGKKIWVALTPGSTLAYGERLTGAASIYARTEELTTITLCPHIDMKASDGTLMIGWLARQTDLLAEDWIDLDAK